MLTGHKALLVGVGVVLLTCPIMYMFVTDSHIRYSDMYNILRIPNSGIQQSFSDQFDNVNYNTSMENRVKSNIDFLESSSEDQKHYALSDLPKKLTMFKPSIPRMVWLDFRKTFFAVTSLFQREDITYMLYGGTLIGANRHQTFIPWDDDTDLFLNISVQPILDKIFKDGPIEINGVVLDISRPLKWWKIYLIKDVYKPFEYTGNIKHPWTWPFIDLFFFEDDGHNITDVSWRAPESIWKKTKVFPLQFRPFEGTLQPVPLDIQYFVPKKSFSTCVSSPWNHRTERVSKFYSKTIPCSELYPFFPFVFRQFADNYEETKLYKNQTLIASYRYLHTNDSVTD